MGNFQYIAMFVFQMVIGNVFFPTILHPKWIAEMTKTTSHKQIEIVGQQKGLLMPSFHVYRNRKWFIAH